MKNLYSLLNLPAGADSQQVNKALSQAAEQKLLPLNQLQEIKDNLSTPAAKAEYDVKLFQTHPELWEALNQIPTNNTESAGAEAVAEAADENNYSIFVQERLLSPEEQQLQRMRTINKSTYIISGFFGGVFGLHHLLIGDRAAATVHLIISLTVIGLPVMFLKSLIDIYKAAARIPDDHGMIHL
ncbi:hypothetical protein [Neisseria sp. 83E34]|uniref:hypothetical protein n=1 Tax=Neisseria sp. 83E34 TaxID=1692264 RepID=UPI0006CEA4CC|nr:hypothetical protein [Neisseria sp. 83E34]KPN72493.1 hypothetical protein AKG09_01170 [Neisseria sp. 83E34]